MSSFRETLVLLYLNSVGKNYDIQEINRSLGLGYEDTNILLREMIRKGYIKYNDYLLTLTDKGLIAIKEYRPSNIKELSFQDELKIDKSKATSIDEPYVPKKF